MRQRFGNILASITSNAFLTDDGIVVLSKFISAISYFILSKSKIGLPKATHITVQDVENVMHMYFEPEIARYGLSEGEKLLGNSNMFQPRLDIKELLIDYGKIDISEVCNDVLLMITGIVEYIAEDILHVAARETSNIDRRTINFVVNSKEFRSLIKILIAEIKDQSTTYQELV